MTRPAFGWVLVGWLCAAGAAFAAMFDHNATDDFAGWILVIVVLQLPAFLALRPSPDTPFTGSRRWGLALPAALAAGIGVFWLLVPIGFLIWEPTWLEFRPMLLALACGLIAMFAAGSGFGRMLRELAHPRGTRQVLLAVTALGAAGAGSMALRFGEAADLYGAEWIIVALPLLWTLPLWILLALRPPHEPPIPRVIVSR